ncbi:MAG: nickel pincer cofactor biosynthesis protein LarC [Deltaproteobacteria bacterium]|nr:nickel pincer cofactor biosynthesis protein LarC [Deltaproteobacteria bacterium]
MRVLYFDAFAGVSGDMTVGALLALGVPLAHLRSALGQLPVHGYRLRASAVQVHGIGATKFDVDLDHDAEHPHHQAHAHRHYRDIRAMLEATGLSDGARRRALAIFARLAAAEAHVHGVAVDDVAFHEVGAVDSIVDIVATAIGMEWLGVERVYASSLPLGSGLVRSQHGVIPVPGPATVELLRDFPVRVGDGSGELVTPTGAAIVAALAQPGAALPPLRITAVGYGAGTRPQPDRPNLLRLMLGERAVAVQHDGLVEIAASIDDANPELYAHALEAVLAAGARDAWLVGAQMKKQRPGVVLHALVEAAARDAVTTAILRETTAIGLRFHAVERVVLPRRQIVVDTPYGQVQVKLAEAPDGTLNVAPEHDDCRRVAQQHGVALKLVYQAAIAAALARV